MTKLVARLEAQSHTGCNVRHRFSSSASTGILHPNTHNSCTFEAQSELLELI